MSSIIRSSSSFFLCGLRVLARTFYTLLAESNNFLFTVFASFYDVRLGFMFRRTLWFIAFHAFFSQLLGFCSVCHVKSGSHPAAPY